VSQLQNKKSNKKSNKDPSRDNTKTPKQESKETQKHFDKTKAQNHIHYQLKEESRKQHESLTSSQNKLSDDEQDSKSYKKRELISNWSKYEITENIDESEGVGFDELLEASST
jgi:hypothetical protein